MDSIHAKITLELQTEKDWKEKLKQNRDGQQMPGYRCS